MRIHLLRIPLPSGRDVFTWVLLDAAGMPRAMQCGTSTTAEKCRTDALGLLSAGHRAIDTGHGLDSEVVTSDASWMLDVTAADLDVVPAPLVTA